jgi:thiamine pyrophosphokinase
VPAAIVFAAAPLSPTPRLRRRLARLDRPFVIAADDGATTAFAFGLTPDLVIGDLDSLARATREQLERTKVPIEHFPRDKDATDGQLAVERALQANPRELWLVGFLGGPRLDQAFANVQLLSCITVKTVLVDERNEATLVRGGAQETWAPESGEIVSLLPLSEEAAGVSTRGLRWSLRDESLRFGDTRGVSNEPNATEVSVRLASGLLLVTRHFPD